MPGWGVWCVFGHFVLVLAFSTTYAVLQVTNRMARYGDALFVDKALTLIILLVLPIVLPLDALRALICAGSYGGGARTGVRLFERSDLALFSDVDLPT